MKTLITGGAGFIASNLATELESQGHEVIVVDNLSSGNKENLKDFKGKFIQEDVSSDNFDMDEKFDVIFHLASITDPRYPNDDETYNKNINGFKNIIKLAQKTNAKLIYISSASVYGNGPIPMKEDQEKEPSNAYAKSKLEMDRLAEELFDKIHIVGLRFFNVFGKGEEFKGKSASMIYHLYKQIKAGKNPRIFSCGEHARDHIYIKDVIDATIKAMDSKQSCIVNVGTGKATTFNELVKILNEVMGTSLLPKYFDMPYDTKTYQSNTQADTKKAEDILRFKAEWTLKKGIEDYIKWLGEENKGCGKMYCAVEGCGLIDDTFTAHCIKHGRSVHRICGEKGYCKKCSGEFKNGKRK